MPDVDGINPPAADGATAVACARTHTDAFDVTTGNRLWTKPGTCQSAAVTADVDYLVVARAPKNELQGAD
jgi:hypothetical protein